MDSAPKQNFSFTAALCSRPCVFSARKELRKSLSAQSLYTSRPGPGKSLVPGSLVGDRRCPRKVGRVFEPDLLLPCVTRNREFRGDRGDALGEGPAGDAGVASFGRLSAITSWLRLGRPLVAAREGNAPQLFGRGTEVANLFVSPSRAQFLCFRARSCASFAAGFRQRGASLGWLMPDFKSGAFGGQDFAFSKTPFSSSSCTSNSRTCGFCGGFVIPCGGPRNPPRTAYVQPKSFKHTATKTQAPLIRQATH